MCSHSAAQAHTPVFGDQGSSIDCLWYSATLPQMALSRPSTGHSAGSQRPTLSSDPLYLALRTPTVPQQTPLKWCPACLLTLALLPPAPHTPPLHHPLGCPPCMDPRDSPFQVPPVSRSFPGHRLLSSTLSNGLYTILKPVGEPFPVLPFFPDHRLQNP